MKLKHLLLVAVLLTLVGAAGTVVAEDSRTLKLDESFSVTSLPTSGPDFRVGDFTVVGDRIYYAERVMGGSSQEHYVREIEIGPTVESSAVITGCQLYSLSASGDTLHFFDFVESKFATYDTSTRRLDFISPTPGYHSLQGFQNGNIIANLEATGLLNEHGALSKEKIDELLGFMTKEELQRVFLERHERAAKLGVYDTVLLDADLRVKKPLLYAYDHPKLSDDRLDNRDPLQRALHRRLSRMSPDRTLAAVFSIDRPGITVFDQEGNLVSEIASPGPGKILPADNPYAGEHVLFQSDVVVGNDHLMVVDNPSRRLWVLDFEGRKIASFEEPFVVLEAERVGEHLYLRGCSRPFPGAAQCWAEGRFARYYYPQVAASAIGSN